MSEWWDSIYNAGADAFEWIGNQFSSSGATDTSTPSAGNDNKDKKEDKSFWDSVFTAENLQGVVQGGAEVLMADQKKDEATQLQAQKLQDQMALNNQAFEHDKALLALKAAMGGGGGGGGPDPRRERFLARLDALKGRMVQRGNDTRQVADAMSSLAQVTSGRLLGR